MAGSLTDYGETLVLDAIVGETTLNIDTWCALYTVAPTDSTSGTEVTGGAYARKATATLWAAAAAGAISNDTAITFVTASGANWGTIVAMALCDASTAGNIIVYTTLDTNKVINDGDTFEVAIGDFDITAS